MDIQKFFTNLGVPANLAKHLVNPEDESLPEDFDAESEMKSWQESQKAVWKDRLKTDIESEVGEKLDRALRTKAKSIVEAFDLDMTKTDAFDKGFEEVLSAAKESITNRIKTAGKQTDEELSKEINKWKTRAKSFEGEIDDLKTNYENALSEAKNEAAKTIHQFQLKDVYRKRFDGLDYGVKKGTRALFERAAADLINQNYKVELDGSIFGQDGGAALSFDKKKTYRNVDEAIIDLAEQHEVLKKSNIPPDRGQPGGGGTGGEESEATRRMRERFERHHKRQPGEPYQ